MPLRIQSTLVCDWPKAVHVRAYCHIRLGRFEHVCEHCRSKQKSLNLTSRQSERPINRRSDLILLALYCTEVKATKKRSFLLI